MCPIAKLVYTHTCSVMGECDNTIVTTYTHMYNIDGTSTRSNGFGILWLTHSNSIMDRPLSQRSD